MIDKGMDNKTQVLKGLIAIMRIAEIKSGRNQHWPDDADILLKLLLILM
jgi:aconitate hydratase 2/2-methylisocitrate dehydratase